jgi:glyoxylase-like metal-dependent hydrolase (beta-lactamase superfamily II)
MRQTLACLTILCTSLTPPLAARQDQQNVQIRAVRAAEGVYMLLGRGGNIGLSIGADGAFLVDDQYAPLTDRILAAVAELTDRPVRFVVNTHWHEDHTGGNEAMGAAGALIVAHENVRERMSVEQFIEAFDARFPAAPPGALPVITFADAVTFHWNGDEIHVFHVEHAHTDGDAVIHFTASNVIHMGDAYFSGTFPFIDVATGGSIDGVIAAADRALALANAQTRIIPGHGALSNPAELRAYRDMLVAVRDRVRGLAAEGKSKEEIVAAKPTAAYDEAWGGGFIRPDVFVGIVFDSVTGNQN